jgi:thioredoxin 1|tara:strand:+ start:548 stop:844 length:297 start_codon:yes stop_codon:yes gene_type:complete
MSDFNEIINSEKPTLVDFYATWCGPCQMLTPILEGVSTEVGDNAKVLKVDIEKNMETASQYGVRSVPTLILFKEGKEVWRQTGLTQKNVLVETINRAI